MNSPIPASLEPHEMKLQQFIRECEKFYLENILTATNGNKTRAAELAGVSLPTLREKLGRYTVKAKFSLE